MMCLISIVLGHVKVKTSGKN